MRRRVVWTAATLTCLARAQLVELTNAAVTSEEKLTCDALTNVKVGGSDWTNAVRTACIMWPPQIGSFPVNTTSKMTGLLDQLVSSEMWQKTRDLFKRHQ